MYALSIVYIRIPVTYADYIVADICRAVKSRQDCDATLFVCVSIVRLPNTNKLERSLKRVEKQLARSSAM